LWLFWWFWLFWLWLVGFMNKLGTIRTFNGCWVRRGKARYRDAVGTVVLAVGQVRVLDGDAGGDEAHRGDGQVEDEQPDAKPARA